MASSANTEVLQLRVFPGASAKDSAAPGPTLVYLPGLHGDWTLLGPFKAALAGRARLVAITYPRVPTWTLSDYARALQAKLRENGIQQGWILGESFSSQVSWPLVALPRERSDDFRPQGLILVGGFVRHPWPWGVYLARRASHQVPSWLLAFLCRLYQRIAGRRYRNCPDVLADLSEFVQRRTIPADRPAITGRYGLITSAELRPTARKVSLPVYQLTGAWDPIVPWWQVRTWLRRNCPGYHSTRVLWGAGHNVLMSAPDRSADQILAWIAENR